VVTAFWAEPSQLAGGARTNKQNPTGRTHKPDQLVTGRQGAGKGNTRKASSYLDVRPREDANSAMVLAFIPVLVDLLVNVNNISFLQRKLPVNNTSTPSELHWSTDALPCSCPAIPRAASAPLIQTTLHPMWKLPLENYPLHTVLCRDPLGILSKQLLREGPANRTPSSSSGVKLKQKVPLAALHVRYGEQHPVPVLNQVTSQAPSKETRFSQKLVC